MSAATPRAGEPAAPPPPAAGLRGLAARAGAALASAAQAFEDAGVTAGHAGGASGAAVPATLHGAPATAADGREVLARLRRMTAFEAQDFDPVECDVERAVARAATAADYAADEAWRAALSLATGVAMGGIAFAVDAGLEALNDWKFGSVAAAAAEAAARGASARGAALGALLSCVLPLAVVSAVVVAVTHPLAAGSGIPETKAYLNGVHIPGLLALPTLAAKLLSITLGMAAGMPMGKEGPFVHAGAVVGGGLGSLGSAAFSRGLGARFAAPRSLGGRFKSDADHRDFVFTGAAAGVATAFGAPVGGLLLAVEEGASHLSARALARGFLATCAGVTTLQLLAQAHDKLRHGYASPRLGVHRDLGLYPDDVAGIGARYFFLASDLPPVAALGAAAGLYGAAFIRIHVALTRARAAWVPPTAARRRVAEVAVVAALAATLAWATAATSPCAPLPPADQLPWYEGRVAAGGASGELWAGGGGADARGVAHFPRLWCAADEYSVRGQLFMAPLVQATRRIIHLGELAPRGGHGAAGAPSPATLAIYLALLPPVTLLTFGLGTATGVFIPSMAAGGAAGRLLGAGVQALHDARRTGLTVSLPMYAAVGAAACLGGVTRMALAVTVLAVEGAGALQAVVPIALAVLVARAVGDAFGPSIYDVQIKMRGAPVLVGEGERGRGGCGSARAANFSHPFPLVNFSPSLARPPIRAWPLTSSTCPSSPRRASSRSPPSRASATSRPSWPRAGTPRSPSRPTWRKRWIRGGRLSCTAWCGGRPWSRCSRAAPASLPPAPATRPRPRARPFPPRRQPASRCSTAWRRARSKSRAPPKPRPSPP